MKKYLAWLLAAIMLTSCLSLAANVSADVSDPPPSTEPAAIGFDDTLDEPSEEPAAIGFDDTLDESSLEEESPAATAVTVDDDEIVYGDVDGDNDVTMKDVLSVRKYIAGYNVLINMIAADVNGDQSVDMKDVLLMRKFIAGIVPALTGEPIEIDPSELSDLTSDLSEAASDEPSEAASDEPSEALSEEPSEAPSDEPSEAASTEPTTAPTMPPITDSPVIYDEDVTAELSLKPGTTLELDDITAALEAETAKYGLAEQYIITVRCHAVPSDYYYSILLGDNGAEVWPDNSFDHDYIAGSITHNTVSVLVGQEFADAGDAPTTLYFYADGENGTLFIEHIKIEVVRRSGTIVQPTSKTTTSTQSTQATTRTTQPGDNRPVGTGDFTYVGDEPYITFRSYGDECTLGTWWWYTDDATNTTTCDKYLDFLYMNGVDEIYFYGYYWCSSNKTGLHSFVQKANDKGMAISLIYDDADTITASGNKEMSKIATNYLNYCAAYPSDQMAGIHFDVEGVSRDNMVTNMISQFAAARERGVYIAMDVNCKWTSSKTLNGVSGFMNIAAANLDCLSLMSYQDTANGIWNLGSNKTANPFGAAKTYGTKIVFGVEVGHYSFNADSDEFAQEGKEICYTELAKVREKLIADHPTGGYGLAVHMVRDWYTLKNTK